MYVEGDAEPPALTRLDERCAELVRNLRAAGTRGDIREFIIFRSTRGGNLIYQHSYAYYEDALCGKSKLKSKYPFRNYFIWRDLEI